MPLVPVEKRHEVVPNPFRSFEVYEDYVLEKVGKVLHKRFQEANADKLHRFRECTERQGPCEKCDARMRKWDEIGRAAQDEFMEEAKKLGGHQIYMEEIKGFVNMLSLLLRLRNFLKYGRDLEKYKDKKKGEENNCI